MGVDRQDAPTRFSLLAFILRLVAIIVLPLGLVGTGLWWFVSTDQVDQALDQRALTVSRSLEAALGPHLGIDSDGSVDFFDTDDVTRDVEALIHPVLGEAAEVRVVGLDGLMLFSTTPGEIGTQFGLDRLNPGVLRGVPVGEIGPSTGNAQPVAYSVPVALGGVTVAAARLDVVDDQMIARAVDRSGNLVYLFGGAMLGLTFALIPLSWWSLGEVRRQFHQTRVMAMSDDLTGLANRVQFHRRLEEALAGSDRGGARVGLVVLDLDGFKAINDTGGHAAGDRLLRRVAAGLDEATRRQETPCRLGGDEFAVIAPRISDRDELRQLATRLHDQLDMVVPFSNGRSLRVTASLGLALYPDDAAAIDELVGVADKAMYRVKASRKAKLPPSTDRIGVTG